MSLVSIARNLSRKVDSLSFAEPVCYTYNPLAYAKESSERYLNRYGGGSKRIFLLGMNPGPFGMAQTGVPFGDIDKVKNFLGIEGRVSKPEKEHPKRLVEGFECVRGEVSGQRLWGWAEDTFGSADAFFETFFVWNYCPLSFMEDSGRNRTPDKLPIDEREKLFTACDEALVDALDYLSPEWAIGIGLFAEKRIKAIHSLVKDSDLKVGRILHPSPASPAANRGWASQVDAQFQSMGISLPNG